MFTIHYFSETVRLNVAGLSLEMRARYAAYTERMKQFGAHLGMPHSRALGDGLFELRLKDANGIARVFFCVAQGQRIVMLHSFIKKTQATPKRELDIARRRKKETDHA